MSVRLEDRRKKNKRSRQIWRHLRTGMRLLLRHPVLGVGIIPLLADGRIVLVRRVDNDRWSVPGGMVDWGETITQAVERELEEESNLELVRIQRLMGVYSSPKRDPRMHAVSVVVVADVQGTMEIHDPLEISEIRAFTTEEIPWNYLAHDHEQQLRDYLSGNTVLA